MSLKATARLIIAITLLLTFAYARIPTDSQVRAQGQSEAQDYVTALQDQGLVTDIGMSKTIDNTTVTLSWAYVDVHQVMFRFEHYNPTDKYNAANGQYYYFPFVDFMDEHYARFNAINVWRGLVTRDDGQTAWEAVYTFDVNQALTQADTDSAAPAMVDNYLAAQYGDDLPDTLRFKLLMDVTPTTSPEQVKNYWIFDAGAPYQFEFEVPLHRAAVLTPQLQAASSDLDLTLASISSTPASTRIELCQDEHAWRIWWPDAELTLNGALATMTAPWRTHPRAEAGNCVTRTYSVIYAPGSLNLHIDGVNVQDPGTQAYWSAVADAMAAHDVTLDVTQDDGWVSSTLQSKPDSMTDNEFFAMFYETQRELQLAVDGTWDFDTDLPPLAEPQS